MAAENKNPINNTVYELLVSELERLNQRLEDISEKLNDTNIKLTEVSGMKHAINDLKDWKKNFEESTKKDVSDLKTFRTQIITIGSIVTFIIALVAAIAKFF